MPELLAPAGTPEALVAAVQNGADAVYLGFTAFGARGYAANFDADALRWATAYCHLRGCRVYVTVNTLVKQKEMADLHALLALLCDIRTDAVIVQDAGVTAMARVCFPNLTLHASTQMALHNAQGARFAKEMGFARVVAARECSLAELRAMADAGIEVEAFIHGALCVSVSGQCLFSSMVGGRSGNRGRCAQPCRLPYRCGDQAGHLLSTRDLMLLAHLPALADAGIHSLKIEGRMKRPEYVAIVTRAYRRALDALAQGRAYHANEATVQALRQVFHRGGFTRGHALGDRHAALLYPQRPGHGGLYMGKISALRNEKAGHPLARLPLALSLHEGDGLQARGKQDADFVYAGPDVAAGETALLRVPAGTRVGDEIYRLTDAAQMIAARESWAGESRPISVDARLRAAANEVAELSITDGTHTGVACTAQPTASAAGHPLDTETARAQVAKMGDSPFRLSAFSMQGQGGFLPRSTLNALRRDALADLAAQRLARPAMRALSLDQAAPLPDTPPLLIAQTPHSHTAQTLLEAGADAVYWAPDDYRLHALDDAVAKSPKLDLWFVFPQVAWGKELEALAAWVRQNAHRLAGVVWANPGQCMLDIGGLSVVADDTLHTMSAWAARAWADLGAARVTLSPELNVGEAAAFARGGGYEVVVYGRAQLMLLNHCPRLARNGAVEDAPCDACGSGVSLPLMTDRRGYAFPLRRVRLPHGCMVRLYNALPTWLGGVKHAARLRPMGVSWRLRFTDESADACLTILRHARAALDGVPAPPNALPFTETTAGHFSRGVE
ncbi:MAG: U32 family peptidase [Oscillospiraceae bacterium]|jgi:putative protease|nr:U32 family peptidase [Oscillospiraceae bacterium]